MAEFEKYFETYKDMLQIIRKKWMYGINYSFQNSKMTHHYREPLNEETVKLVYVMLCSVNIYSKIKNIINMLIIKEIND